METVRYIRTFVLCIVMGLTCRNRKSTITYISVGDELWPSVAFSLGVKRLAKQGRVLNDAVRSPNVTLLLGDNGWVEHVDNGIR